MVPVYQDTWAEQSGDTKNLSIARVIWSSSADSCDTIRRASTQESSLQASVQTATSDQVNVDDRLVMPVYTYTTISEISSEANVLWHVFNHPCKVQQRTRHVHSVFQNVSNIRDSNSDAPLSASTTLLHVEAFKLETKAFVCTQFIRSCSRMKMPSTQGKVVSTVANCNWFCKEARKVAMHFNNTYATCARHIYRIYIIMTLKLINK